MAKTADVQIRITADASQARRVMIQMRWDLRKMTRQLRALRDALPASPALPREPKDVSA